MAKPIPVTLRYGHDWRCKLSLKRLRIILDYLTVLDPAEIKEAAIEPLRLDPQSRREDGTTRVLKTDHEVKELYKINKGLAMEMASAAVLTYTDHPEVVFSYCGVNLDNGLPNHPAPSGAADIVVRPAGDEPAFRIVCEVSAYRSVDVKSLDEQLSGAVSHAERLNEDEPVPVTYGLLINPGRIGEDKALQNFYREFVAGKKGLWWQKVEKKAKEAGKEAKKGLEIDGPIRVVSMYTGEFVSLVHRLEHAGVLSFDSVRFARALDILQDHLRNDIPEKEADWMATRVFDAITGGPSLQKKLFDASTKAPTG